MNTAQWLRAIGVLLLLAAVIAGAVYFAQLRELLTDLLQAIEEMGVWGPGLLAAVYIIGTVLCIPGSLLTLGAGAIFGFVRGYIAVTVGSVLGACAAFLVGRTLARGWVERRLATKPKFQAIDRAVGARGFKIVLLTRLSPVFPFTLLNYAFGLTRVSLRDYAVASFVGMIPGTVMYVALGVGVGNLARLAGGDTTWGIGEQILFFIGVALTVVVTIYVTRIARKALREATPDKGAAPEQGASE